MKIYAVENSNISHRNCVAHREDKDRSPTRRSTHTQLVPYFSVLLLPILCIIMISSCLLMPARAVAQQSTANPCPPEVISIDGEPVNTQMTCKSATVDNEYGPTQIAGGKCPNIPASFPTTYDVTTEAEFDSAYASVQPGDAIIMKDGSYVWNADVTLDKNGTAANPIYIIYETLHGFVCNSCSRRNNVTGDYHVFAGFKFNNHGDENFIFFNGATGNRVACMIFDGSADSPVKVNTPSISQPGIDDLEVDNNEFIEGDFVLLDINDCGPDTSSSWCTNAHNNKNIHIHHNSFTGPTSEESIKLGLGSDVWVSGTVTRFNDDQLDTIVENNIFTNTNGDPEIISIKSSRNIIRNNCVQGATRATFNIRSGHDNLIHGNWLDEVRDGPRIAGHRNYILFNYIRVAAGDGNGFQHHNEIEHPSPRTNELNYYASKDGFQEFNVLTGIQWMIYSWFKSPIGGTVHELPNGNMFQNNDFYTDSLSGNNSSGSYVAAGGVQSEANFRANNTWGSNSVTASDLAGSTCGNAALFDGPGTTFNVPSTVLGGAKTILAPTWW